MFTGGAGFLTHSHLRNWQRVFERAKIQLKGSRRISKGWIQGAREETARLWTSQVSLLEREGSAQRPLGRPWPLAPSALLQAEAPCEVRLVGDPWSALLQLALGVLCFAFSVQLTGPCPTTVEVVPLLKLTPTSVSPSFSSFVRRLVAGCQRSHSTNHLERATNGC